MFSSSFPARCLLLALPLLSLLGACSVREDRSSCPCLLVLDLSGVDADLLQHAGYDELLWSVRSPDFCVEGRIPVDELPPELVVEVPRAASSLVVLAGDEGLYQAGEGLRIPEGEDCPPLLAFSAEVEGTLPEITVPVVLHKRFARLDVLLRDLVREGSSYELCGTVCGYGMSLSPLPGNYRVPLFPDADGHCQVCVPAQLDVSLVLCVYRYGELEQLFGLGRYIEDSGYDWMAADLEDIPVEIEFFRASARIRINLWSKTLYFSIAV